MEITPATLGPLFLGFEMLFQKGFAMPPTYWEKICMLASSSTGSNVYPWLGQTSKFREWVGPRVMQMLEAHSYAIVNKDFEDTVAVKRNSIQDDTYGVYTPMFENLGWDSKVHPDELVFGQIKDATVNFDSGSAGSSLLGYDGKTFFSKLHPVGLAGATSSVANIDDGGGSNPFWYLVDASRPVRAFIFQKRQEYTMTRMNALTDESVFMEKIFRFGVDARVNAGWGLWQLAYASNLDLTPDNYNEARAAMRSFKTDAGKPFGSLSGPNVFLMVPPLLEGKARQILNSSFMVGMGTSSAVATDNVWKGTADLIVSEYLTT
jgi:phage major head subunit gpT-like protein